MVARITRCGIVEQTLVPQPFDYTLQFFVRVCDKNCLLLN